MKSALISLLREYQFLMEKKHGPASAQIGLERHLHALYKEDNSGYMDEQFYISDMLSQIAE